MEEIAALLELAGAARFKVKAYEQAARVVRTLGDELGPLVEQNRLRDLQGIGAALSRQISELWNGGASDLLLELRREHPEGAAELVKLRGLTPRRIRLLHAALGIRSVDELSAACAAGRVRGVRGFGEKTEQRLLAACERWRNRAAPVPPRLISSRALELAALVQQRLAGVVDETHLAGALRRGAETVDELELVVVGDVAKALRHLSGLRQVLRVDLDERLAYLSSFDERSGRPRLRHHHGASRRSKESGSVEHGVTRGLCPAREAHVAGRSRLA